MKFKTVLSAALIVGSMGSVYAADSTIHLNGALLATGCDIAPVTQIELGDITVNDVIAKGEWKAVGSPQSFNIVLSGCSTEQNAVVTFGETADSDTDYALAFKLNPSATAKGIGVTITDTQNAGVTIPPGGKAKAVKISNKSATLKYAASYVVTTPAASVAAGTAPADINFTVSYS